METQIIPSEDLLLEAFRDKNLADEVKLLNELLWQFFLKNDNFIKINSFFMKYGIEKDGLKTLTLSAWYGNEVNPTLELVQNDGRIKLGMTHYGALSPLSKDHLVLKKEIVEIIIDFIINTDRYYYAFVTQKHNEVSYN